MQQLVEVPKNLLMFKDTLIISTLHIVVYKLTQTSVLYVILLVSVLQIY